MSPVEFKATILQECITIHNQLRRRGLFTAVRDALLEKAHPQISLRAHIFNNLINVYGASSFLVTEEADRRLAEKARLSLENIIPRLYRWFVEDSVDAVLRDRLECDRAREPPRKKQAAFETNLPVCRRGENKFCRVEEVIRAHAQNLLTGLRPLCVQSEQFQRAVEVFESVLQSPARELSHRDCRRAGDCLIALEAQGAATHALSSNAREWEPLAGLMGLQFVRVTYPEERTV
jgi:hypothetical protein